MWKLIERLLQKCGGLLSRLDAFLNSLYNKNEINL